jgi:hypothetical protein
MPQPLVNTSHPLSGSGRSCLPTIVSVNPIMESFSSHNVIIIQDDLSKKWILANDIAKVLNIKFIRKTIQNFDNDERGSFSVKTNGGVQESTFLSSDGVYRLLFNFKHVEAKKFRKWACKILNDVNFNNCQEIQKTLTENPPTLLKQSDLYNETSIYIRIKLPDQYCSQISKEKDLNLGTIKPGIAFHLRKRNGDYTNGEAPDNGYFIYSFSLHTREDAVMIENIYKRNFKDFTVYGSTEYFDTSKLAKELKYTDFDKTSYKSYLKLAKKLFDYIVNLIKFNFKGYEVHNGYVHEIEEVKEVQRKLNSSGQVIPSETYITTIRKELKIEKKEIEGVEEDVEIRSDDVDICEETNSVIVKIVGRDLETGKETIYDSITDVCIKYNCTRVAFTKTYLDKPFQFKGFHWRRKGNKVWLGIENLVYNREESYNFYSAGYVKAINTIDHTVEIYEGYQAAQKYTKVHPYAIRVHVKNKAPYKDILWSILPTDEFGKWVEEGITETLRVLRVLNEEEYVKPKSNHKGKIIAFNLDTKEETVYRSMKQFSKFIKVSNITLTSSFLNAPRQVKGYHIRSQKNGLKWFPPANLIFDSTTFQRAKSLYIFSVNENDERDITIYESQTSACKICAFPEHSLKYPLKFKSLFNGHLWNYIVGMVGELVKIP